MNVDNTLLYPKTSPNARGCGLVILVVFFSLWMIALSGLDLFASWIIEQSLYESVTGIPDVRWVIQLVFSIMTFVPCLILTLAVKTPRIKLIFRLWMLASILGFLTIPLKTLFLTAQNETAILQMSSMSLLLVGIVIFRKQTKKDPMERKERSGLVGLAGFLVFGLAITWILWGALGSVLDTVLEIGVGILFALLVVTIAFPYYLERTNTEQREIRTIDFLLDGFVLMVFLLILVASIAHNGSQQLLAITVPICGWILAAFSIVGIGKKDQGMFVAGLITFAVVALPLMFFDMDELSLVISSGTGEVMSWASKAAWFTFMTLLVLFVVVLINFKVIRNLNLPKKWNMGLLGASLASIAIVYAIWGQVGFFGDKIFVILKPQLDVSSENQISDYVTRRAAVYSSLVNQATNSQMEIRKVLDKYHLGYTPYYLVNAIEVEGGNLVKIILNGNTNIDRILDSPQLRPLPQPVVIGEGETKTLPDSIQWNLKMIRADEVLNQLKISGEGIVIGQTDSGVDGRHPELTKSYRGNNSSDDFNWLDPWNNSTFPVDNQGHGTQTLGLIVGENIGIAPDAQWIGCVNLARNLGNPARYLDCMQFMLAPFPQGGDPFKDGNPSKGAMIVNNSWGCPTVEGCDAEVYVNAMRSLAAAGVFMSAAAGNTGNYGCASVTDPIAIYADVFTAGSVNEFGNISDFSSIGPVLVDGSNRQKPDLLAPGENLLSSFPGGTYATASGTSFAAPQVTGVVALMWSANPKLIGNISKTTQILKETAQPYNGNAPICGEISQAVGAGVINAYAAVTASLKLK
jgi:subtilisin family serine protease